MHEQCMHLLLHCMGYEMLQRVAHFLDIISQFFHRAHCYLEAFSMLHITMFQLDHVARFAAHSGAKCRLKSHILAMRLQKI